MIPDVIYTMKPSTVLVISQEDADELGLERNTTAGAVQEASKPKDTKKAKEAKVAKTATESDMYNEDPYTEI